MGGEHGGGIGGGGGGGLTTADSAESRLLRIALVAALLAFVVLCFLTAAMQAATPRTRSGPRARVCTLMRGKVLVALCLQAATLAQLGAVQARLVKRSKRSTGYGGALKR